MTFDANKVRIYQVEGRFDKATKIAESSEKLMGT